MSQFENPGQGDSTSVAGQGKEWERKQRAREYRVAARREKRNRKADEKKQRKLNATILRRMTRNPDKYNKNAERNRSRAVELERRNIYQRAVQQAQRLAAIHDPSGVSFNVCPVVKLDDDTVIPQELFNRREERRAEKAALEESKKEGAVLEVTATIKDEATKAATIMEGPNSLQEDGPSNSLVRHPVIPGKTVPREISKKQQKKIALYTPRPPPPKPIIPHGISIPEGEEDWLSLWDLPSDQVERRVLKEKKHKAAERKALRVRQQSGKAERRAARDEKRRVYREIKLEWKAIKEEQSRHKTKLKSLEDEESKKIAVQINIAERQAAMDLCASLGFTIESTPGTAEIKPKALGMKGVDVDFNAIEKADKQGDIRLKQENTNGRPNRTDLAKAAIDAKTEYVPTIKSGTHPERDDFIKFDVGEGQDFQTLSYNHKLRRKLRRAIDTAETQKETLVRDQVINHLEEKGEDVPPVLRTPYKPLNVKGHRILDSGKLETAKQERVRARMELTEFNTQMKVLRKQAKDTAVYAGLRKHAVLTGSIKDDSARAEATSSSMMSPHVNGDTSTGIATTSVSSRKRSRSVSTKTSSDDEDPSLGDSGSTSMSEASSAPTASNHSRGDEQCSKKRKTRGEKIPN